jgi:hypothetical protein
MHGYCRGLQKSHIMHGLGDAVVSDIMKGLDSEPLVSWFAVKFGRRHKQLSGGSDNGATGSEVDDIYLRQALYISLASSTTCSSTT